MPAEVATEPNFTELVERLQRNDRAAVGLLIERYGRRTGIDVSKIAFYRVFACYKTAVVAEQIYVRYVRGQTKDERFAMLGPVVPLLVEAACQIAKESWL